MGSLEVISLNVNGLRNPRKRKQIFRKLKENKLDVICLQETFVTIDVVEQWEKEWGGELIFNEGTQHGKGQIILIRKNLPFSWSVEIRDDRILAIRIKAEKDIVVFNIYAPCGRRETIEFFNNVKSVVNECNADLKTVCGDFNAVMSNEHDIISGNKHPASLVEAFNNLVIDCELNDIWRIFNEDIREFSWSRTTTGIFIARRLDYIFLNEAALNLATSTQLLSFPSTDHRGVRLSLNLSESKRGPGYYKFNNSLLNDKTFIAEMKQLIREFLYEDKINDPIYTLELLKIKIREKSISYSKMKSVEKRNKLGNLYNQLNICEAKLAISPDCQNLHISRERTKTQIELLEHERLKSSQLRSKIKYITEGDKNTKYFFNLEKNNATAKLFPNIELEDGQIITNQHDIRNAQREFYKNLYSHDGENQHLENNIDTFLRDSIVPSLTENEMNSCEGEITLDEATKALKDMNSGSSPGPDGLSTEFYRSFWAELGEIVVKSFNKSFITGSLSHTQTSAILTLIHKGKELPRNKLQNWRPISLTNTDYKILAKCLASRVSKVLKSIISEDQVGYMKGRNISTTLRTIDDLIEYWNLKNKPGILLALDFQKAFDSISKKYMVAAFKKFGFGPTLQKWVEVLFANTRSSIIYNGWVSEDFEVNCGIRQGCPFSPLAFIIGVEILAIRFRENKDIKGLEVDVNKILKVLMYADDITVFLKDYNDVKLIIDTIDEFTMISGLKLNKHKSEAMGIGANKNIHNINTIKCVNEIKILGIHFSNSISACKNEKNWIKRIEHMKKLIAAWEKRNIGIIGKICIAKSLLISQLVFVIQAISLPEKVLKEINTLLYRFLWRKKDCNRRAFEKVKRVVINSEIEKGGLKMIDLKVMQDSFLCERITKLITDDSNAKWTWIPGKHLDFFGKDFACLSSTIGPKSFKGIDNIKSDYWKDAVKVWLLLNKAKPFFIPKQVCIWNNERITHQNNVLMFEAWAKKLTYISDITQNGNILDFRTIEETLGRSPKLYLEYNVVYNAVTRYINRHRLEDDNRLKITFMQNDKIPNAKDFRRFITDNLFTEPCSNRFWLNKHNIEVNENTRKLAWNTTQEVRLRELQWKILHNIYPTNILLEKMGIATDNRCSLCRTEIDYIEHFFFSCSIIKHIWDYITDLTQKLFNTKIKINETLVIFGIEKKSMQTLDKKQIKTLNHIILIAKMCISKYRYGTPLNLRAMLENEMHIRNIVLV